MALQSMTALKSMSIEKLMNLKSDVEAMLAQKVSLCDRLSSLLLDYLTSKWSFCGDCPAGC
jgi:hypothetical protein